MAKQIKRLSKFPKIEGLDQEVNNIIKQILGLFEDDQLTVLQKSGAYNLKDSDSIIVITNGVTVNLPSETSKFSVKVRYIKNIGATAAAVKAQSGSKIDDVTEIPLLQYETAAVIHYNNNWYLV
jgi:hypothetical protein